MKCKSHFERCCLISVGEGVWKTDLSTGVLMDVTNGLQINIVILIPYNVIHQEPNTDAILVFNNIV